MKRIKKIIPGAALISKWYIPAVVFSLEWESLYLESPTLHWNGALVTEALYHNYVQLIHCRMHGVSAYHDSVLITIQRELPVRLAQPTQMTIVSLMQMKSKQHCK